MATSIRPCCPRMGPGSPTPTGTRVAYGADTEVLNHDSVDITEPSRPLDLETPGLQANLTLQVPFSWAPGGSDRHGG